MFTRREFLKSSTLLALAPTIPVFLARTAGAALPAKDRRVLVVVQLDGGNDALNTVVPFADPNYEKCRPRLKIEKAQLVRLSDGLGLHPSLKPLDRLLEAAQLAILPGVGYPNPNRSHFESLSIWQTARFDPEERQGYGWIGRALDSHAETSFLIGTAVPGALRGHRSAAVALNRLEDGLLSDPASARQAIGPDSPNELLSFVRREAVQAHAASDKFAGLARENERNRYPGTALAERLKFISRLIKSELGARVYYTVQAGYDTHASQTFTHANLLGEFAGAVAAFFDDLNGAKLSDRVTLLAFSEFGRTIKENGSAGTDHGTAGAVFLAGPGVRGGICGAMPSMTDLRDGEPKMTTDFRRIYASVLEDWLRVPAREVLAGDFDGCPLFTSHHGK